MVWFDVIAWWAAWRSSRTRDIPEWLACPERSIKVIRVKAVALERSGVGFCAYGKGNVAIKSLDNLWGGSVFGMGQCMFPAEIRGVTVEQTHWSSKLGDQFSATKRSGRQVSCLVRHGQGVREWWSPATAITMSGIYHQMRVICFSFGYILFLPTSFGRKVLKGDNDLMGQQEN